METISRGSLCHFTFIMNVLQSVSLLLAKDLWPMVCARSCHNVDLHRSSSISSIERKIQRNQIRVKCQSTVRLDSLGVDGMHIHIDSWTSLNRTVGGFPMSLIPSTKGPYAKLTLNMKGSSAAIFISSSIEYAINFLYLKIESMQFVW